MAAATKYKTREDWLKALTERLNADLFDNKMPKKYRVTCGWPSSGAKGKRRTLGECYSPEASEDKATEITITMALSDAFKVAEILTHEMVHAIVGNKCGHRGPFRTLAIAVGLEGKMTSTHAGKELAAKLKKAIKSLGKYPHGALALNSKKKQSTRLIKCECPECGYNVRITRKWLNEVGEPLCPLHDVMEEA